MLTFTVIPGRPRTAAAGDILLPTFANVSTFPGGSQLAIDLDLHPAQFVNLSTFPPLRVQESAFADVNLQPAVFTNVSTFPSLTSIAAAPPDADLHATGFSNISTFPPLTVSAAPPDANILPPRVVNTSTFNPPAVQVDTALNVASGAGSAAGASTVAATGAQVKPAIGSAVGLSTVAATGASIVSGDETLISTLTAANSPTLEWTGLSGTSWRLVGRLLVPVLNTARFQMQFGTSAGYIVAGYDHELNLVRSNSAVAADGNTGETSVVLGSTNVANTQPGAMIDMQIDTDNANWIRYMGNFDNLSGGLFHHSWEAGGVVTSAQITSIKIFMSAGNISSGTASLYRVS